MAHRLLRDVEKDGWERSDFPIICESCLGDNPYVRMTRADYDKECKICTRPFTVFRWRPGRDARFKKSEVCQTCSKLKNVCQVCLLDLEYGLPVQVRDTALSINSNDSIPKSDVNREYFAEEHDRRARAGLDYESSYGKARANDTILKLQRTTPYYKRNRAHVCSFYVRGECTRGAECPYRHEMPVTGELSQQNIPLLLSESSSISKMESESVVHYGGCHCGRVRWRVQAPASVVAWQCNCSDCSMRANTNFIVPSDMFELLGDSKESLTTYTFGTHVAKHTFCKVCGITSFYFPRSNPDGVAVTFRCVDPGTLSYVEIKTFDGRNWESSYNQTGIASCSNVLTEGPK